MSPAWAVVLTFAVAALAAAAMLLVRRRAPEGSFFEDGDRAAGVFGVIATGFAVLLGLIVFLAFESYDESRAGAEDEARAVEQQFETAQFMPAAVQARLSRELTCYARYVVHSEWPRLESSGDDDVREVSPWGKAMFRTLKTVDAKTFSEQTAYDKWFDRNADRETARNERIHGAVGVIPGPLWVVLLFSSLTIFVFMMFFADSAERWYVQALMPAAVVAVMSATLFLINFLDDPFRSGFGGLKPVAMERTLDLLEEERLALGQGAPSRATPRAGRFRDLDRARTCAGPTGWRLSRSRWEARSSRSVRSWRSSDPVTQPQPPRSTSRGGSSSIPAATRRFSWRSTRGAGTLALVVLRAAPARLAERVRAVRRHAGIRHQPARFVSGRADHTGGESADMEPRGDGCCSS